MKYLGVDFGLRRIGLAVSDGQLASPYKILIGKNPADLVEQVKKEAQRFDKVVVGMPEGETGNTVLGFIKALRRNGLDVSEADETLSSKQAVEKMVEFNIPKEKRKFSDDMAAAIILQNWLDEG